MIVTSNILAHKQNCWICIAHHSVIAMKTEPCTYISEKTEAPKEASVRDGLVVNYNQTQGTAKNKGHMLLRPLNRGSKLSLQ